MNLFLYQFNDWFNFESICRGTTLFFKKLDSPKILKTRNKIKLCNDTFIANLI